MTGIILEADAAVFTAAAWVVSALVFGWLAATLVYRRYLFLKPGMLLVAFHHVLLQWPAALQGQAMLDLLPDPYAFFFAAHVFPLAALAITSITFHGPARAVWERVTAPEYLWRAVGPRALMLLAVIMAALVLYYLSRVPLRATGLYAILTDPVNAALAREQSLKLLGDRSAAYAYLIMAQGVAPLLTSMATLVLLRALRVRRTSRVIGAGIGLLALLVLASLSGARVFAVNLLLVAAVTILILKGMPLRPLWLSVGAVLILAPAALLSLAREGRAANASLVGEYLFRRIGQRVFVVPVQTGSWYLHYSQTVGPIGVRGVPKLAAALGEPALDVPNTIGLRYETNPLATVSTVTGYVFSYFSYFGYFSIPISLFCVFLVDAVVLLYMRLPDAVLLPAIAAATRSTLSFIDTDFTTVLVSQGLLVSLALAFLCTWQGWRRRYNLDVAGL